MINKNNPMEWNITPEQLGTLKQWVSAKGLTGSAADDMLERCLDTLERHAFTQLISSSSPEQQSLYSDMIALDGEIDGFAFFCSIYGEDLARTKLQAAFERSLQMLISQN